MKAKTVCLPLAMTLALAAVGGGGLAQQPARAAKTTRPATIHDLLWVWGNPEMAQPGQHTAATFAEASPACRAQLLGVPNVVLDDMK